MLEEIVHVPLDRLGTVSGQLVFYDELLSMAAVLFWGAISDTIGRHWVYSLGYLVIGISFVGYPYAKYLYPDIVLLRLLFASGGAAVSSMLAAVLGDISEEDDRGTLAGIAGLTTGLGALVGLFVFLQLPVVFGADSNGLAKSYIVIGMIAFVISVYLFFALPKLPTNEEVDGLQLGSPSQDIHRRVSFKHKLWRITESVKNGVTAAADSRILLGYVGSFLSRGDTITITLFLPTFIYVFFVRQGLCAVDELGDVKTSCRSAYTLSSILSGVTQTFALIAAPLFGILADKMYRPLAISIAALFAMVGYFLLFLITDPRSKAMYLVAFLVGVGEIGMVVISLTLVSANSIPVRQRGGVAGVSSFAGALGILLTTSLGGHFFDLQPGIPFLIVSVAHCVCLILSVTIMTVEWMRLDATLTFKESLATLVADERIKFETRH